MKKILTKARAKSLIDKFSKAKVLVIGDLIMDHFIWGTVKRISPEAPVPVVDVKDESIMLGGSANVVNNLRSLKAKCLLTGVVGNDFDGKRLLDDLKKEKVSTDGIIVDKTRLTTIKTRVIAHSQQVVRFDREVKEKIKEKTLDKVLSYIETNIKKADIVILSDYAKGVITKDLAAKVIELANKHDKMVAVDPKTEHYEFYKGATFMTPNNLEASQLSGIDIVDNKTLKKAEAKIAGDLNLDALLVTRGEHGMSLFEASGETHIPTVAREVFDVSGAGDTVIAIFSLALAVGASFKEAAALSNIAAGIVVGKVGTAAVTREELLESL